ncbi:cupin domain-containing protein [Microbacterium hominis]|uniref:Cupin domain-containing protein n=1 Tax=Microbacterium hominis TaxID=162426 RepID=A0A7D4TLN9_9MICO|nr:cupin domain-containing protein [Microbacterium hominis]QKJ18422.1 cupin domain-containing protein [Microbacterium hominis]
MTLEPGRVVDAATLRIHHEPVAGDQVAENGPTTGFVAIGELAGAEVGVWEMTEGAMRDVEAEELFVVIAGDATVEFTQPALPAIELSAGSVVRLAAGMRTVWTVRETLRKVYIAP